MEKHLYVCEHCGIAYVPKKRNIQKFCSTSCRVSAFNLKTKKSQTLTENIQNIEESNKVIEKEETINAAGIGNAAIGSVIVEGAKHFLTHPENRPATKGDLDRLEISLKSRYHPVINLANNIDGTKPYYDNITKKLVYLY